MIAETDIERARQRFDVVASVVPLKRQGRELVGLCPFHNEKTPSFAVVADKGFFHCFSGDTGVPTRDGVRSIGDLIGRSVDVVTHHNGWQPGFFDSFGRQTLWELTLTRNGVERRLLTTAAHRWFLRGRKLPTTTAQLFVGARLEATTLPKRIDWTLNERAIAHGIVFGDGTDDDGYGTVNLHDQKAELVSCFWPLGIGGQVRHRDAEPRYLRVYGGRAFGGFKQLPERTAAADYLLGFLAGWLATDGCVDDRGAVTLSSARRANLQWAREVVAGLSIETTGISHSTRRGLGRKDTALYHIEFRRSSLDPALMLRSDHRDRFCGGSVNFERKHWVVADVHSTGRAEEVYCAQVPAFGAFGLEDDLLTGNCFGCGAHGTAIDFVMRTRNLDFTAAVRLLLNLPMLAARRDRVARAVRARDDTDGIAAARAIWEAAGTDYRYVSLYLQSRYLPTRQMIPPVIREHPALLYAEPVDGPGEETPPWRRWAVSRRGQPNQWFRGREFPALIAAFQSSRDELTAVQRIWLEDVFEVDGAGGDPKGSRVKNAPKKTRGTIGDGAVRLATAGSVLGLAEGIESAWAASALYRLPVWALGGLARLGYPAHRDPQSGRWIEDRPPSIWIPPEVSHLVIFGDGNESGRLVAEFAAVWWRRHGAGRTAEAVLPEFGYGDFQDKLRTAVLAGAIR